MTALALCSVVPAAAGSASTTSSTIASAATFVACVVTDTGGIHDRSFNASAWQGLRDAKRSDPTIAISYLSSTSESDYAPNINTSIAEHCGIIITVGYLMDGVTATAADAHPDQRFAIVDDAPVTNTTHELRALQYETNQASFLGGMLAAGMSKTGKVATYGGENFASVALYMDGFVAGVRYYDYKYHAKVEVLGWTPAKGSCSLTTCEGTGTFVGNFSDPAGARAIAARDFTHGADIVFPVDGPVGLSSVDAARRAGRRHYVLWLDSNGCVSHSSDCKYFVGTVAKGVEASVAATVLSAAKGTFKGGTYVGTLKNDGAGLQYGGVAVPRLLKKRISAARAAIVAGTLSVNPNKFPTGP